MPIVLDRRAMLALTVATVPGFLEKARAGTTTSPVTLSLTLEAGSGAARLRGESAPPTSVWCFNGLVPGPVLRVARHGEVKVRLVNELDQPTSLHWHGVRIANAMDGVAGLTQAAVEPGASFDYRFTAPDAGTFWYHPEVPALTAEQVGRGLYGVLIVDEPKPPPVDADVLVVLDDWRLAAAGEMSADFMSAQDAAGTGRIGDLLTANTKPAPQTLTHAPGARLRLRLLNAANARILLLSFDNVRPLIIAIDGQPCEPFEPVRRSFPMGPGARFDVVLDLPADAGAEARMSLRGNDGAARDLLVIETAGAPRPARPAFTALPRNPALPIEIALENAKRVDLAVAAAEGRAAGVFWTINGTASRTPSVTPAFRVRRGTPVVIGFVNRSRVVQAMRIHGHVMRLLHDLDDGWEPYWRDSVLIEPGKTHHVAFLADNPGKWLIHSAILEHSMTGASTWFEVT
jgi:FtsP/CotA-like multicopper oxidase with cupredoxin domain